MDYMFAWKDLFTDKIASHTHKPPPDIRYVTLQNVDMTSQAIVNSKYSVLNSFLALIRGSVNKALD